MKHIGELISIVHLSQTSYTTLMELAQIGIRAAHIQEMGAKIFHNSIAMIARINRGQSVATALVRLITLFDMPLWNSSFGSIMVMCCDVRNRGQRGHR